jgi:hypothetical protein
MDNTFSWKTYIEMTTPKLSQACYNVRVVEAFLSRDIPFCLLPLCCDLCDNILGQFLTQW